MTSVHPALFGGATILAMLVVHRVLRPWVQKVRASELVGDNHAYACQEAGLIFSLFLVGHAVSTGAVEGESIAKDALFCGAFGLLGFVLLEISSGIGKSLLLGGRLKKELASGNVAAGVAAGAHHAAMGLLVSKAVSGSDWQSLGLSLTFFGLGLVAHQGLIGLFRWLTIYDDQEQIAGENLAAALSYAGVSLAVAVVVRRGLEGDFEDWSSAIQGFLGVAALTLLLYPIRQIIITGLLLGRRPTFRGGALDDAISADRNAGVALLEGATYLAIALAITHLV